MRNINERDYIGIIGLVQGMINAHKENSIEQLLALYQTLKSEYILLIYELIPTVLNPIGVFHKKCIDSTKHKAEYNSLINLLEEIETATEQKDTRRMKYLFTELRKYINSIKS